MRLRWLPEAKQDVERLHAFLKEHNPQAASRAARCILDGASTLSKYPEIGRPMDDELRRREFSLPFGAGAYVLRYRLHDDTIVILRVWHSRETRG